MGLNEGFQRFEVSTLIYFKNLEGGLNEGFQNLLPRPLFIIVIGWKNIFIHMYKKKFRINKVVNIHKIEAISDGQED